MKLTYESNRRHYGMTEEAFEKYYHAMQEALCEVFPQIEAIIYEGDNQCLTRSIVFELYGDNEFLTDIILFDIIRFEDEFFEQYNANL